jgi:DNA-binding MarR family transcriptional regulator
VSHPVQDLDDVVHQRNRLAILATVHEASRAEFAFLKNSLGLTDGNLSRHLQILEEAGYVKIEKGYAGRKPKTWVRITRSGRGAFRKEIRALRTLLDRVDGQEASPRAEVGTGA